MLQVLFIHVTQHAPKTQSILWYCNYVITNVNWILKNDFKKNVLRPIFPKRSANCRSHQLHASTTQHINVWSGCMAAHEQQRNVNSFRKVNPLLQYCCTRRKHANCIRINHAISMQHKQACMLHNNKAKILSIPLLLWMH